MSVGADKAANLVRAAKLVKEAATNGAQVISLPVGLLYKVVVQPYTCGWNYIICTFSLSGKTWDHIDYVVNCTIHIKWTP